MISYKCTTCTSYASRHSFRAQRPMAPSSSTSPLPGKNQLGKALLFRRPGPAWRSGACFAFLRAVESKGGSCGGKPPPLCRAVLNPGRRRQSSLLCAGLSSRRSSAAPAAAHNLGAPRLEINAANPAAAQFLGASRLETNAAATTARFISASHHEPNAATGAALRASKQTRPFPRRSAPRNQRGRRQSSLRAVESEGINCGGKPPPTHPSMSSRIKSGET